MDNIIMFWELMMLASTLKEDMVVLFFDFEKAYHRVDWTFHQNG
jgi:hypothetical protein